MAKEYKYKADTPAADFLKVLQDLGACKEAIEFNRQHSATVRDIAINTSNQSWVAWNLKKRGEETDPEIRRIQISKIQDPGIALMLYVKLPFWTDEEDKLLEGIFKGKLPTAERNLREGIVKRQKVEVLDGSN